ncbi:MAG: hypothetical protein IJ774_09080 [Selenomonadaceae bacterium]|nr:hypothetical protein [Selenomonadaceae bacterium]
MSAGATYRCRRSKFIAAAQVKRFFDGQRFASRKKITASVSGSIVDNFSTCEFVGQFS